MCGLTGQISQAAEDLDIDLRYISKDLYEKGENMLKISKKLCNRKEQEKICMYFKCQM